MSNLAATAALLRAVPELGFDLDPADEAAASAYIEAILRHNPRATNGADAWKEIERSRLWMRFVEAYAAVADGPYRRLGPEAVRVALGAI